jgi:Flp pilus assembly protein TadD
MLTQEELIAYFERQLPADARAELEQRLAAEPEAQSLLAGQENIDLALRVLLGPDSAHQRVKQSIFTVLHGASQERLTAHVMAEAREAYAEAPDKTWRRSKGFVAWLKGGSSNRKPAALPWGKTPLALSRKPLLAILSLVALACGLLLLSWPRPPAGLEIGRVVAAVGEPWLTSVGKSARMVVQASAVVHFGDRLETGDADRAEVQFRDGTVLRLQFNTAVEIPLPDPKSKTSKAQSIWLRPPQINLLQGQIWTKVQKSANATPYAVRTTAATALARGTEFWVKLSKSSNAPGVSGRGRVDTNVVAVLTVKEGAVDFFNSFGSVQATAMTESTARADGPPTEPKRLGTLQVVQLDNSTTWSLLTSSLEWPEAAMKLVGGGGAIGWHLQDFRGADGRSEVRITQLPPSSAASRAGLRVGDVITTLDGQILTNARQLTTTILLRPGAVVNLGVHRADAESVVAVTITPGTNLVRGPNLSAVATAQLVSQAAAWLGTKTGTTPDAAAQARRFEETSGFSRSNQIRAAALNNLGVVYELDDVLGPAIRAYGRAVYLAPEVPLYRFNLGLALRKIGSFERAQEEFAAANDLGRNSVQVQIRQSEIRSLLGDNAGALAQAEASIQAHPDEHGLWELKAQILSKENRAAEAAAAARQAVALSPDCPVALGYFASALQDQGSLTEAEVAYRDALARAPFEPSLHLNLGTLQQERGDWKAAEQSFRTALEQRPDFALAYRNLGAVLIKRRAFAEASAAFQKATELNANDGAAHRGLGEAALKRRQFDQAEQAYRTALEVSSNDHEAYYGLGEVFRLRRRFAEAQSAYQRAIELKGDYALAYTCLGVVFAEKQQLAEAEKLYRKAMELDPKEAAPFNDLGELYRQDYGNLNEAERWFRKAFELAPDQAEPVNGLGLVAAGRGQLAEAERLLRNAQQLAPDSPSINNNLGEILRQRGRLEEAEPFYRKALQLDPDYLSPYGNLGIVQAMRRQFAEAEQTFRMLLARTPAGNRLRVLVNLASVCGEAGKLDDADRFFREALGLSPNEPHVCSAFASFLADHNLKLDEALGLARRAVAAAPGDPNNLDALGWTLTQRGEFEEADTTLRRALEIAGQEPPAKEIREHINKLEQKKRSAPK